MKAEFSRPVRADSLSAGQAITVEASETERAALAARLGVPGIAALSCRFVLEPGRSGVIGAVGELRARVTQVCVVSLDPFEAVIAEDFRLRFVPERLARAEIDPDEREDEVPYAGGTVDLGESVAEQLALALDPYPRKPGAASDAALGALPAEEVPEPAPFARAPFARLAALRRKE